MDTIFHEYFTEGKNISDFDVLADMSEQVGVMPKDQVRKSSVFGMVCEISHTWRRRLSSSFNRRSFKKKSRTWRMRRAGRASLAYHLPSSTAGGLSAEVRHPRPMLRCAVGIAALSRVLTPFSQIFRKLAGKGRLHPIPAAPSCGSSCPIQAAAEAHGKS